MSVVIHPAQSSQSSSVESVEVVASGSRSSLAEHLAISAGNALSNVAFSGEVPPNAYQASSFTKSEIVAVDSRWSAALEHRFAHLAARIAANTATDAERDEFRNLQSTRRRVYLARGGAAILRDFEERQRTAALIDALKKYVEFAPN